MGPRGGSRRMMARRMMMHRMMSGGSCHGRYEEPPMEDQIGFLEEYQRDLEQETADVAERIRRLKERQAEAPDGDKVQI